METYFIHLSYVKQRSFAVQENYKHKLQHA